MKRYSLFGIMIALCGSSVAVLPSDPTASAEQADFQGKGLKRLLELTPEERTAVAGMASCLGYISGPSIPLLQPAVGTFREAEDAPTKEGTQIKRARTIDTEKNYLMSTLLAPYDTLAQLAESWGIPVPSNHRDFNALELSKQYPGFAKLRTAYNSFTSHMPHKGHKKTLEGLCVLKDETYTPDSARHFQELLKQWMNKKRTREGDYVYNSIEALVDIYREQLRAKAAQTSSAQTASQAPNAQNANDQDPMAKPIG